MVNPAYIKLAATATRLIKKWGKELFLVTDGGVFDPIAGQVVGGSTTKQSTYGVVADIKESMVNGETVFSTDNYVILESAVAVNKAHKLEVDGEVHEIVKFKPLNPGGVVVIYELVTRT